MIVVDTNTIASLYLEGDQTAFAEQVLRKDSEWLVPRLWRSEFRNVLTLYLRRKILALDEALRICQKAERFLIPNEVEVPSAYVLGLILATNCSAYDCEFVALAQHMQAPFITSDKKLLQHFPDIALSLKSFAENPK